MTEKAIDPKLVRGAYTHSIRDILEREMKRKYGEDALEYQGSEDVQRYFSLKLPINDKTDFLKVKAALSLATGQNISNVDVCRILVAAAYKELVEEKGALKALSE